MTKTTQLSILDWPKPLAVGFDRVLNRLMDVPTNYKSEGYPPYNIVKISESDFIIELAVAGFKDEDLFIEYDTGALTITGNIHKKEDENKLDKEYQYKGIVNRSFQKIFQLAENVIVSGANLDSTKILGTGDYEGYKVYLFY